MADGGLFIHKCARDAHEQITQLSDFVSPTVVAMWNLRWQVRGFLEAVPAATQADLVSRFALRSGVRGNEIKRACVHVSWEEQEARFASILLTNSISILEDFVESLASLSLSGSTKASVAKALQFPAIGQQGYLSAYTAFGQPVPQIAGVFVPGAMSGRWYAGAHIQNLLLCYRFFKEIRNVLAHQGGKASSNLVAAYAAFQPVATPTSLGMVAVPEHEVPVLGQPVVPKLRGVNLFSNVILRIIATYDADLGDRNGAFQDISTRLGSLDPRKRQQYMPKAKISKLIEGMLTNACLPPAVLTTDFVSFLKNTDRIPAYW